jgi:ribosomal-protein-alanine N-acetyltransferase
LFPNLWEVKEFIDDRETNYSEFLIARQNEDIVGFIAIKKVFDELEVVNIVTRADKRQQGIGSNLLSYIIRKYADVRKINLEVGEHNIVAKNLYCEFGFRPVGRRENYYKDHDDAILMSL